MWAALVQLASAVEIDEVAISAGEFRDNAYTSDPGTWSIHPFMRSHYGISERVDLKVSFLGQILGPRGSVEVGLVQTPSLALSIEPEVAFGWGLATRRAGATARLTLATPQEHRFNVNLGGFYARSVDDESSEVEGDLVLVTEGVLVPVDVGFDLVAGRQDTVRFQAGTSSLSTLPGWFALANWNHSFGDDFRLSAGVGVVRSPEAERLLEEEGLPSPPVLPVPTFELWWKL